MSIVRTPGQKLSAIRRKGIISIRNLTSFEPVLIVWEDKILQSLFKGDSSKFSCIRTGWDVVDICFCYGESFLRFVYS